MTSDRWRRIEQIYEAAQQQAPSERGAFLESACGEDEQLRREVEHLIAANDQAGDFLASPAWEVAPSALVAGKIADDREMSFVGRQVGHYRILAPLGSGGMGEVYRAHDATLNREVALKVLPDVFAFNPDRLARFTREAHVLASLNHPNIGAIYGFEHTGDVKAIVLELVEGPTLADQIALGRITLDEALPIARQIADALEAAHERGIVHRDLKPANIKVRADGMVKVLDFGLAKALEVDSIIAAAETKSPTVPRTVVSADGMVVGTAPYMAPEQARGKPADKRADLWAFGCVLYEMLTGRRTFAGGDTSETLAAVLKDEPDWRALSTETPVSIRRLLRRCLAKEPRRRLSDASAARLEIDEALGESPTDVPVTTSSRRTERFVWAATVLLIAVAAVAAAMWARRPEPAASEVRFEIKTPPTTNAISLAISPDGQKIVFVATHEGRDKIWLRRLDSVSAEPLAGTDGATAPFWSPDSRTVGFLASTDNQLKRIDIDSRLLRVLGTAPLSTGGTWNQDGTILFSTLAGSRPILRVTGGEPAAVTRLEPPEVTHQHPQFLPDGRHFLYYSPNLSPPGVFVAQLDGSEKRRLLDADTAAVYLGSGYLLFVRGGTLYAQAFDADRLKLTGDPFRVAGQVATALWLPALSASAASTLVYRAGSSSTSLAIGARPLVWFDRSGKEVSRIADPVPGVSPSLSTDGRQVAVFRSAGPTSQPDIWILDLARDVSSRLTSNGAINLNPIWSPDGREIVFRSSLKGQFDLYRKAIDGTEKTELLLATSEAKMPSDWSHDGRFLLYTTDAVMATHNWATTDIWALPLNGDRKPFAVVQTSFEDRHAQFSPDGHWIAYESNETGQFEIFLRPFPGPGPPQRVSMNGGAQVRWRRDGSELFYIALDGRLTAVPIRFASDGKAVDVGTPTPLFPTHVGGAVSGLDRQQYVVSPDGQRFLMSVVPEDANPSPINVILNWQPRPAN